MFSGKSIAKILKVFLKIISVFSGVILCRPVTLFKRPCHGFFFPRILRTRCFEKNLFFWKKPVFCIIQMNQILGNWSCMICFAKVLKGKHFRRYLLFIKHTFQRLFLANGKLKLLLTKKKSEKISSIIWRANKYWLIRLVE